MCELPSQRCANGQLTNVYCYLSLYSSNDLGTWSPVQDFEVQKLKKLGVWSVLQVYALLKRYFCELKIFKQYRKQLRCRPSAMTSAARRKHEATFGTLLCMVTSKPYIKFNVIYCNLETKQLHTISKRLHQYRATHFLWISTSDSQHPYLKHDCSDYLLFKFFSPVYEVWQETDFKTHVKLFLLQSEPLSPR